MCHPHPPISLSLWRSECSPGLVRVLLWWCPRARTPLSLSLSLSLSESDTAQSRNRTLTQQSMRRGTVGKGGGGHKGGVPGKPKNSGRTPTNARTRGQWAPRCAPGLAESAAPPRNDHTAAKRQPADFTWIHAHAYCSDASTTLASCSGRKADGAVSLRLAQEK